MRTCIFEHFLLSQNKMALRKSEDSKRIEVRDATAHRVACMGLACGYCSFDLILLSFCLLHQGNCSFIYADSITSTSLAIASIQPVFRNMAIDIISYLRERKPGKVPSEAMFSCSLFVSGSCHRDHRNQGLDFMYHVCTTESDTSFPVVCYIFLFEFAGHISEVLEVMLLHQNLLSRGHGKPVMSSKGR